MSYPDTLHEQAREIIARYPEGRSRSALLPLLHLVQSHDGYVGGEGIAFCADHLGLTKAQVQAVSTFYTMYKREPTGDWLVSVCTNSLCHAQGGQKVYEALSDELGVGHDETTADGQITLEHAECLAACDYAPVVTVNYEYFDNHDEDDALELVRQLRDGKRPLPTRGAPLCPLRETSVQLAGFDEERTAGLEGNAHGDPTLAGARLAAEAGITAPQFDPDVPLATPANDKEEAK